MGFHEEIAETVFQRMRESREILTDPSAHEDLLELAKDMSDRKAAHLLNVHSRKALAAAMRDTTNHEMLYDVYKRSLLMDAPYYADEYLLYLESDRPVEERFYQTRRAHLKPIVDAYQMLIDDELDELLVSLPPRVGKTTIVSGLTSHHAGMFPTSPCLYSSYSDTITRSFYNSTLSFMTDSDTYRFADVFPGATNLKTNSAEETIDVTIGGVRQHYPTLTCRSIDGTLNGACDADGGLLIADDLISGIEEAMSKDRLQKKQQKVDNDLLSRAKETTKILWIGTRWSLFDPIGLRLNLLETGAEFAKRRWKNICIPALNENDESNFDYPYRKGFTTSAYLQKRESFEKNNDLPSWQAQYMNQPIERDGNLFNSNEFRYFMGKLPDTPPDRVFMAIDPAFGGGDFVAGPVCVQYGESAYIVDVIYNDGDKTVTQKSIAAKAAEYNVTSIQIECNKATEGYAEGVMKQLEAIGHRAVILPKSSASQLSKANRIWDKAPEIRKQFVFLSAPQRTKEYNMFMKNVTSYSPFLAKNAAKKQHDDAPDSLAQAIEYMNAQPAGFRIVRRPW